MKYLSKLVVVACVCMLGFGMIAGTDQSQADSDAALDTIAIINHINYAVEVIRTYNNVAALEDEYEKISADNLNLNCIRDEESLQLIRDILNTLNNMRMNDRARKWYRHVLTRDLKGAKLNGMAKMATTVTSSLVNGSGGGWSRLWQVATATALAGVESIADYKKAERALQGQLEDKQFELDTEKLNELHKMNDMLLARQWSLINKYRLDDRLRVTGKEVRALVRCVKGSDKKNTFRQLRPMQRVFEVYPTYWYYRAAMAIAIGDYKDALVSCGHFEKINRGLFRDDQMASNIAMIKITAMLGQRPDGKALAPSEKEAIEKGLETICEQNYSSENADQSIFCTAVYLSALDDVSAASSVLDALMGKLFADSQDELREYCDLFTSPKEKKIETPPSTVYLVQCRMLRIAIDQREEHKIHVERLKEICGRETTCSLEKLFYFGELRVEDLWALAKKDIEKINLMAQGDSFVVEIPVAWFLLGDLDVSIELLKGADVAETLFGGDTIRSHVMSRPHLIPCATDMAYVRIDMPVKRDVLASCIGVRLRLRHVSWPLDLVYSPEKSLKEGCVYLVPIRVERFMGKNLNRTVMPNPMAKAKMEFEELKSMAGHGDAKAQFNLGGMYFDGEGVAQDKAEAAEWYRKAAEQGVAEAQYNLGWMYFHGEGVPQDKAEALRWYHKAAGQGDAKAQFNIGRMYFHGDGVAQDKAEAVKWYRKAAEHGDAKAQINLGLMYAKGESVAQDKAEAVKWYRKAAEQGNADAQYGVGLMYFYGEGVAQDKAEAVKWYRKAAEQGNVDAQNNLGDVYNAGEGVMQDKVEAVKWYRRAAELGSASAQKNLGVAYYYGEGVAQDKAEAVKWFGKAAEQGEVKAQFNLGVVYYYGEGVAQDKAEAVKWYRKAAEQGDADAQNILGVCYMNGEGVVQDKAEAAGWFRRAAAQGHEAAKSNLAAVPEPTSWLLVLLGTACLALRRKHHCACINKHLAKLR